jgi:small subunit ribosomal protein S17
MVQKTTEKMDKGIGINVKTPEGTCDDRHCVFHGDLKIRGRSFVGNVVKSVAQKSAVVQWSRLMFIPKYQRYEKRRSKLQVHNPPCINAKVGDKVRIVETRPISKLKNFIIVERVECKQ